ncbi:GNAT family N-acetyltransferase [Staphylococcus schleiferi subsp. coagulans]|uniref:GNAT family N-acetyltransferase n=1 Tax=Staphylococcus coagulans TaxID=74706 RepID=UPI0015F88259|nr:GNAT family N-acetyltransferase [Staphylococcus coagulans]MBA8767674.1 GNAT family N-acetyltransferase [Staphylococcus coagulans]
MIRQAQVNDLTQIQEIYNHAIKHTTAVYTYETVTLEERENWFQTKQQLQQPVFVYERNGEVLGFATYGQFRNWPAYQFTIEHSLYVSPNARREGIASQLLENIIQDAREKQVQTMMAGIDDQNIQSKLLHEKFGFRHMGTLEKVGYKFDQWLDLAFYQIQLK